LSKKTKSYCESIAQISLKRSHVVLRGSYAVIAKPYCEFCTNKNTLGNFWLQKRSHIVNYLYSSVSFIGYCYYFSNLARKIHNLTTF